MNLISGAAKSIKPAGKGNWIADLWGTGKKKMRRRNRDRYEGRGETGRKKINPWKLVRWFPFFLRLVLVWHFFPRLSLYNREDHSSQKFGRKKIKIKLINKDSAFITQKIKGFKRFLVSFIPSFSLTPKLLNYIHSFRSLN